MIKEFVKKRDQLQSRHKSRQLLAAVAISAFFLALAGFALSIAVESSGIATFCFVVLVASSQVAARVLAVDPGRTGRGVSSPIFCEHDGQQADKSPDVLDLFRCLRSVGMCVTLADSRADSGVAAVETLILRLRECGFDVATTVSYPGGVQVTLAQAIMDHLIDVRGCASGYEFFEAFSQLGDRANGVRTAFDRPLSFRNG